MCAMRALSVRTELAPSYKNFRNWPLNQNISFRQAFHKSGEKASFSLMNARIHKHIITGIHKSGEILFINDHMFSIIVCLFIITIDNNFSFLCRFLFVFSRSDSSASRSKKIYNNNIIVIKEARGFKAKFLSKCFMFFKICLPLRAENSIFTWQKITEKKRFLYSPCWE